MGSYYGYGPTGYYNLSNSPYAGTDYLTFTLMVQAQSCGYYDFNGDIHVNVRPGCTLKAPLKTTKDFQQATYQQTVNDRSETFTIATTKKNGTMTSASFGEGEFLEKAKLVTTYQYENGQPSRTILTTRKNGKTEKLAVWDAAVCKQLAPITQKNLDKLRECATFFAIAEKAITDAQAELAKSDLKLAYQDFHQPGVYHAVTMGGPKVADIFGLMKDCENYSSNNGYVQNGQPNSSGNGAISPVKTTN
jgi:hypothetical protein